MPSRALATDKLPDLIVGPITDLSYDTATMPGHRLLRFTTVLDNAGVGAFELHGSRPDTSTPLMSVTQRIFDTSGGFRDVATAAQMQFDVGDGHNHWHTLNLMSGELDRLDYGSKVGTFAKQGFCFGDNAVYDLTLPGAPQSPVYVSCGVPTSLAVTMGLSVGWADPYTSNLAYQWVDITGLNAGNYRLILTADAVNWFTESNETNNTNSIDIHITPDNATPPTVTLDNPANGSTVSTSTPTFSGSADNSSESSPTILCKVYNGTSATGTPVQVLTATRGSGGAYAVTPSSPLPDGTYTAQSEQAALYAGDSFSRTVASGATWGFADTGGPWSARFANSGYSTDGNVAQIVKSTSGTYAQILTQLAKANADVNELVRVRWNHAASGTGNMIPLTLMARYADSSNFYQGRLIQTTSGALLVHIVKTVAGTNSALTNQVQVASSYALNSFWWVRFELVGSTLRIRAWPDGTNEPSSWQASATDSTFSTSGAVGIMAQSYAGSTATPTISYDDFGATGNTGFSSANTFNVQAGSSDTIPPSITLTAPANGATVTTATPAFSGVAGTATGDSTSVTVKVYSGSAASGSPVETLTTPRDGVGAYSVSASPALASGTYTAQAEQTDTAGNTGKSSAQTFTVQDSTAPVITLVQPSNGSVTTARPTFSGSAGTAADDSSSVTVMVYSGTSASGTPVQTLGATHQGDGTYSVAAVSVLADGTYTARSQQSDSSGNVGFSSANTFTVTTSPVAITTTSLPGGKKKNQYSATLAASGGTTPYTWSISSGILPPGLTLGASTGKISGKPILSGTYSFTAKVVDSSIPAHKATRTLSISVQH
jgi:hypothetical protein